MSDSWHTRAVSSTFQVLATCFMKLIKGCLWFRPALKAGTDESMKNILLYLRSPTHPHLHWFANPHPQPFDRLSSPLSLCHWILLFFIYWIGFFWIVRSLMFAISSTTNWGVGSGYPVHYYIKLKSRFSVAKKIGNALTIWMCNSVQVRPRKTENAPAQTLKFPATFSGWIWWQKSLSLSSWINVGRCWYVGKVWTNKCMQAKPRSACYWHTCNPSTVHLCSRPTLLSPTACYADRLISLCLYLPPTHTITSVWWPLSSLLGQCQNCRSGQPHHALHSTSQHCIGILPPALDDLVLILLCTLFLSNISFTSQYHMPPAH